MKRKIYIAIGDKSQPMALEIAPYNAFFTFSKIGEYPEEILEIDPDMFRPTPAAHGLLLRARSSQGSCSWAFDIPLDKQAVKELKTNPEPGLSIHTRAGLKFPADVKLKTRLAFSTDRKEIPQEEFLTKFPTYSALLKSDTLATPDLTTESYRHNGAMFSQVHSRQLDEGMAALLLKDTQASLQIQDMDDTQSRKWLAS